MKHGKKYNEAVKKYDLTQVYDLEKAVDMLKNMTYAKFDESVDVSIRLKLKKSHTIRDTVVLPNSFGKKKTILVFAKGDHAKEAKEAGAEYVGDDEYIEKIKNGWLDFDVVIATPDMMKEVGKLGPVLGRRGLMPNPKLGTVTTNIKSAIEELRKGRIEYRADKSGVVHLSVGKKSMDSNKLKENIKTFFEEILRKRPNDLKGEYIGSMYISSTMSPSVKINTKTLA
jgi:large subunit ribosomal protein L1